MSTGTSRNWSGEQCSADVNTACAHLRALLDRSAPIPVRRGCGSRNTRFGPFPLCLFPDATRVRSDGRRDGSSACEVGHPGHVLKGLYECKTWPRLDDLVGARLRFKRDEAPIPLSVEPLRELVRSAAMGVGHGRDAINPPQRPPDRLPGKPAGIPTCVD